jgi:hypothetical protein
MSDTDTEDDPNRLFVRALFAPDADEAGEVDEPKQKPPGNFVAREGNTPQPPLDRDADMRAFTRELFGFDPA